MKAASCCVCCEGPIKLQKRALVSPFLASRIWGRKPLGVELFECTECGFLFYNPRLESDEEKRLYANYQSDEYQKMRQASEPWYSEKFNKDLSNAAYTEVRRKSLKGILRKHTNLVQPRVLDFGGHRGELVTDLLKEGSIMSMIFPEFNRYRVLAPSKAWLPAKS